ncbi:MAG: lipase maturation factor family protein [bacterium]
MRFGGKAFCRQRFGASLCAVSLDGLGTSVSRPKGDRELVERLKVRPSTRRKAAVSKPRSSGARRSPKRRSGIDNYALAGLPSPLSKPAMFFDGDCDFCRAWIERLHQATGERVDCFPYQQEGWRCPDIGPEQFAEAVHLVDPEGRVWRGCAAVVRALAWGAGPRWPLRLYERVPWFAGVMEACYRFVARHRGAASVVTRILYGDNTERPMFKMASFWFLRAMGLIYFAAFVSLWHQIDGLIGQNGILSAGAMLTDIETRLGGPCFWQMPTLCWFDKSDWFLHVLCGTGTTAALFLMAGILPAFACLVLWVCYLSLTTVSGIFLGYQWDNLLLETGFLAIFAAPLRIHSRLEDDPYPPRLGVFLFRFLLFKLMFSCGYVKLTSGDAAWSDLTSLAYHYWTQPLPAWTAWYANLLPLWAQKVSCVVMFGTELVIPFLFWAPRRIRHIAGVSQIALQLLIIATGNYGFFNYLILALCLWLLDDTFFQGKENISWVYLHGRNWPRAIRIPFAVVIVTISTLLMTSMLKWPAPWPRAVLRVKEALTPFRTVNSYSLFAIMTKIRPEIIVEGSDDGVNWMAYEFEWKPGDLSARPRFVAPHQPRLDWQMWFAAMGTYYHNPWFSSFLAKLLQGSPEVLKLIAVNPFPDIPPKAVRASYYEYRFTTPQERRRTGNWWRRDGKGLYCPPIIMDERE